MIVDERIYTLHVGKVPGFFEKILCELIEFCPKEVGRSSNHLF